MWKFSLKMPEMRGITPYRTVDILKLIIIYK